jgi:hypothetical protein
MSKKAVFLIVVVTLAFLFGVVYVLSIGAQQLTREASSNNTSSGSSSSSSSTNALNDPQALVREVRAYMQQQGWNTPQQQDDTNMTRVAEGIVKSKYLEEDSAVVVITENWNQCWSGSIMGSDSVSSTHEACNTGYLSIPCSGFFGSYSLALQRTAGGSDGSEFLVQVWKDGELLKQGSTSAEYGVVSFGGDC